MPEPAELTKALRESGRVTRLNQKNAAKQQISVRNASEVGRRDTQSQRFQLREHEIQTAAQQRVSTQEEIAGNRRTQRIQNAALFDTANSSVGFSFGMIVALFFVMIIIYVIVTNGSNFGNLMGSVGTFISGLSSNSSLFVKKAADTTATK